MSKRITIMIDDDLDKKLRQRQARMIQQSNETYSYSKTINDVLRKTLWASFFKNSLKYDKDIFQGE